MRWLSPSLPPLTPTPLTEPGALVGPEMLSLTAFRLAFALCSLSFFPGTRFLSYVCLCLLSLSALLPSPIIHAHAPTHANSCSLLFRSRGTPLTPPLPPIRQPPSTILNHFRTNHRSQKSVLSFKAATAAEPAVVVAGAAAGAARYSTPSRRWQLSWGPCKAGSA